MERREGWEGGCSLSDTMSRIWVGIFLESNTAILRFCHYAVTHSSIRRLHRCISLDGEPTAHPRASYICIMYRVPCTSRVNDTLTPAKYHPAHIHDSLEASSPTTHRSYTSTRFKSVPRGSSTHTRSFAITPKVNELALWSLRLAHIHFQFR